MIEDTAIRRYSGPWTEKQTKHLLRRTMFGATNKDYQCFKGKSLDQCVEILLTPSSPPTPPIVDSHDPDVPNGKSFVFVPENKEKESSRILFLKGWWVAQMINQQPRITEKLVLFWHNHFVTEFSAVKDSRYAFQYLNLLRTHATGNFRQLLREITINPCMLVYLNGNINNKSAPNENYGRELQELFAVGKGPDSHYTEADVKAVAKVLSGWKDDKEKISSYFDPPSHNTEDKIFSAFYGNHKISGKNGLRGADETDELIEMVCSNKEVPKFLCRKLYRWFVGSTIDEHVEKTVIVPLAEILLQSNYEIKPVLKAMFSGDFFYDPYLIGGMFKSPVDYLIGLLREFDVKFSGSPTTEGYKELWAIAVTLGLMGQDPGDPPNVAGWPAYYEYPFYYRDWINSENLSYRNKLARLLAHPEESDRLLMFDFLHFANSLPNPGNSEALLADSLHLLCIVQPGSNKIAYLQSMLDSEHNTQEKWGNLWGGYKANPDKEEAKTKVINRLRNIFDVIFTLPEFQIM